MKTKPVRSPQQESSAKKRKLFLPLFLGGLMVLSTFAIIFSGPSQTSSTSYTYHDLSFRLTAQGWESTLQGQSLLLRHGPEELASLFPQYPFLAAASFPTLQKIYASTLPDEPAQEAVRDFYLNSYLLPPISFACAADVPGCESLPLKTCRDATDTTGVVLFRIGEATSFTVDGTCVSLTAPTSSALTQLTDTWIYTLYGVFP